MKYNHTGFSLLLGIGLVILLTTTALVLLEFIIPFSKNVKGLDNYTRSYYYGWQGVEESLYFLSRSSTPGTQTGKIFSSSSTGTSYAITASGYLFPALGKGESEFDSNRGIIGTNQPVQIYLPTGINWNSVSIQFRVPNYDNNVSTSESFLATSSGLDIINWQIIGANDVINSNPTSRFKGSDICNSTGSCTSLSMNLRPGVLLNNSANNASLFYNTYCTVNNVCKLKISVINQLLSTGSKKIPYLEYKITFPAGVHIPYSRVEIQTSGKSYGFKKDFSFDYPLKYLNEAFDFTVFQ